MSNKHSTDIPAWSVLLENAVNKPGFIMKAYSTFHDYSLGNQLLAMMQCKLRGLPLGPINTFPGWKALGRGVKHGERALTLCMPITLKRRERETDHKNDSTEEGTFTSFVFKRRWFVLSQTEGEEFTTPAVPEWNGERALATLNIELIPFDLTDGNCQGFARKRQLAISPVAQLPHKTLFHEAAHILLGHTGEADFSDGEQTPVNLREVEAESVALLCCEALDLEGAEFCRGYIQDWLRRGNGNEASAIPERSAQKIFRAADQILRAGRLQPEQDDK
jgi:antirestriction factor ArdC-like protein